LQLHYRII